MSKRYGKQRSVINKRKGKFLPLLLISLLFVTIASPFGRWFWLGDIVAPFPLQLTVLLLALSFFCLYQRKWILFCFAIVILLINFSQVYTVYFQAQSPLSAAQASLYTFGDMQKIRIMLLTSQGKPTSKDHVAQVYAWLRDSENKPDIVVLQGAASKAQTTFHALQDAYPHQYHAAKDMRQGVAVLSRFKIGSTRSYGLSEHGTLSNRLSLELPGGKILRLYEHHTSAPLTQGLFKRRNAELHALATLIATDPYDLKIMVGNLNMTPFSANFTSFLQKAMLNNSLSGQGIQTSWPSYVPFTFLGLPIDHILVSDPIQVLDREIGPYLGSGHLPVITTLTFPQD